MVLNIYMKKGENSALFKTLDVKSVRTNGKDFFRSVDVNIREAVRELIGPDGQITDTGFAEIHSCGDFWSTFLKREGVRPESLTRGICSTEITGKKYIENGELSEEWPGREVVANDKSLGFEIGATAYDAGYLITSSAKATNIVGGKEKVWFEKITPNWFKQGGRTSARIFKSEKDLLKFLKTDKNLRVFKAMHENKGTCFGFEKASTLWEHEPKAGVIEEIEAVFAEINSASAEEDAPKRALGSDLKEEAMFRMMDLDLWKPVIKDFTKSDKVYMSEFGGVIYDLNEEAKEAVRRTSEYGLPYHVVRTNHPEIGDMYAVLFVTNHIEEWDRDRFNAADPIVFANVYNASMGIDEMGSIMVQPANGGLIRTA